MGTQNTSLAPWLATAVGAAAAAGWRLEHRRAEERAREDAAERARLERAVRDREAALRREHELIRRLERSRRAEREFNLELRAQLQRVHDHVRVVAPPADARELILRAGVELLEADKGLLLEASDADGDGDLDLVATVGFDRDPEHSALAQRFARRVLERDQTVREDEPFAGRPERELEDADREIHNLVAIPLYIRDRFHGALVAANRDGGFAEVDDHLLLALGDHVGSALQSGHVRRDLHEAHRATIRMLLEAMAARDLVLQREAAEAAVLADSLARALDLEDHDRDVLVLATLLRDVGYLALPDGLLMYEGILDADHRSIVEMHPTIGFRILRQLPALRDVAYTVLYHHEHHDGRGYPFGLVGDDIPLTSRALAVIDAYTAMTHERPHRPAREIEEACAVLVDGAGTQFDPEIAALFTEWIRLRATLLHEDELLDAVAEAVPLGAVDDDETVLGAPTDGSIDGLTLLGTHRPLYQYVDEALASDDGAAVVMIQLEELGRVNEEAGILAGDRLIQAAARRAERVAARAGGRAFRASGRRLAIATTGGEARVGDLAEQVQFEFLAGPTIRVAAAAGAAGERPDHLIDAARATLRTPVG